MAAGSEAEPETGTGRVCGLSASSAPRVTTSSTCNDSAAASSSSQKPRHRMLGSRPRSSTTSLSAPGGLQIDRRVVGQEIRRVTPSTNETIGRVTWKS